MPTPIDPSPRSVFLSYRRLDDTPPPEEPAKSGFVQYLSGQLRWELIQLGVPNTVLWRDRVKIVPGDEWQQVIQDELNKTDLFLAVLSRNYVASSWCEKEVNTIASRVSALEEDRLQNRIFRVDKHGVPDEKIPEPLRCIQAVKFYKEDPETQCDEEYFWRGVPTHKQEYMDAVHDLAKGLYTSLIKLGISTHPEKLPTRAKLPQLNGRTIYVAKPAGDVVEEYHALTSELVQNGYRVLPNPDEDFPKDGEKVRVLISSSLTESEASIHLLGERTGGRPDGLEIDIVPFQLVSARLEAERRKTFQRLIWTPKILPHSLPSRELITSRKPFDVLFKFDQNTQSDQIDGDTISRFTEFVVQRLSKAQTTSRTSMDTSTCADTVYIYCNCDDRDLSRSVARELKKKGFLPALRLAPTEGTAEELAEAEGRQLSKTQNVLICWDKQSQAQIVRDAMAPALQSWRQAASGVHKTILFIGGPSSEAKAEITEFGIPMFVDTIIDASKTENLMTVIGEELIPKLR